MFEPWESTGICGMRLRGFFFLSLLKTHSQVFICVSSSEDFVGAAVAVGGDGGVHVSHFVAVLVILARRENLEKVKSYL